MKTILEVNKILKEQANKFGLDILIRYFLKHNINVYYVGGCVRDAFLGLEPKDIDLLIDLQNIDFLNLHLQSMGKTNIVGKSFSVIKFTPIGYSDIEIDIAIPRIDIKTGNKHTDFIIQTGVTVLEDLKRRDFTINSIAISTTGDILDPFFGLKDIEDKTIKMIDKQTFSDDPLRMLRAVQFSARFSFDIEKNTLNEIFLNAENIKHISDERIIEELYKIYEKAKSNIYYAFTLFMKTNLFNKLFCNNNNNDLYILNNQKYNVLNDVNIGISMFFYIFTDGKYIKMNGVETKILKGVDFISKKDFSYLNLLAFVKKNNKSNLDDICPLFDDESNFNLNLIRYTSTELLPITFKDNKFYTSEDIQNMGYSNKSLGLIQHMFTTELQLNFYNKIYVNSHKATEILHKTIKNLKLI